MWYRLMFWPYAKLMLSFWLVYCNGAAYVYEHGVRPYVVSPPPEGESVQVAKVPKRKRGPSKRDNMLAYFTQKGLEKMMHKDKVCIPHFLLAFQFVWHCSYGFSFPASRGKHRDDYIDMYGRVWYERRRWLLWCSCSLVQNWQGSVY